MRTHGAAARLRIPGARRRSSPRRKPGQRLEVTGFLSACLRPPVPATAACLGPRPLQAGPLRGHRVRVWRQLVDSTPWGRRPGYVIRVRDREVVYGGDCRDLEKAPGGMRQQLAGNGLRVHAIALAPPGGLSAPARTCGAHVPHVRAAPTRATASRRPRKLLPSMAQTAASAAAGALAGIVPGGDGSAERSPRVRAGSPSERPFALLGLARARSVRSPGGGRRRGRPMAGRRQRSGAAIPA